MADFRQWQTVFLQLHISLALGSATQCSKFRCVQRKVSLTGKYYLKKAVGAASNNNHHVIALHHINIFKQWMQVLL